jgi:hypothetical protein
LFGDWGTSRLYVLGLAFLVAGRSSFWLIAAMSLLILAVGWAYTQICRIYPTAAASTRRRASARGCWRDRRAAALRRLHGDRILSAVEHFITSARRHHEQRASPTPIPATTSLPDDKLEAVAREALWEFWRSPGLWAICSIASSAPST